MASSGERTGEFGISLFQMVSLARDPIHLRKENGSTFRGAFGRALRLRECHSGKSDDCDQCDRTDNCLYYRYIGRENWGRPHPVRPYVLEAPFGRERTIKPGTTFKFNMVLVGEILSYLREFVKVVEKMGNLGLGASRGKFHVKGVSYLRDGSLVPIYPTGQADPFPDVHSMYWRDFLRENQATVRTLRITFMTPTRLKAGGSLVDRPEFHILVGRLLNRIFDLDREYCGGNLVIDIEELVRSARKIRIVEDSSKWHWHDWKRYSARQGDDMYLGGIVGEVIYEGELTPFMPYLRIGEYIHVGKQATFGNGLIRVEIL